MISRHQPAPMDDLAAADARVLAAAAELAMAVEARAIAADAARERLAARERIALTVAEAAAAVGVTRPVIEGWTQLLHNPLPYSMVGRGDKRILVSDLVTFIQRWRRNPR